MEKINEATLKVLEKILDEGKVTVDVGVNTKAIGEITVRSTDGQKIFVLTRRTEAEQKGKLRINKSIKYYVTIDGKTYEDTTGKIATKLRHVPQTQKSDDITFLSQFLDKSRK